MLIAEDRAEDVDLLKIAHRRGNLSRSLHFVRNGEQVIDYLSGNGPFSDRSRYPIPEILLELNMPKVGGFEVLAWHRSHSALKRLFVIIFTSSDLPRDVNRAYDLGANSYLVKTHDIEKLQHILQSIDQYWLKLNLCPDISLQ